MPDHLQFSRQITWGVKKFISNPDYKRISCGRKPLNKHSLMTANNTIESQAGSSLVLNCCHSFYPSGAPPWD